jgi:hypothetical protein
MQPPQVNSLLNRLRSFRPTRAPGVRWKEEGNKQ